MGDWWRTGTAAAVVTGVAGSAYMWATSEPDGYKLPDLSVLDCQGVDHPDIPACKSSALLNGQEYVEGHEDGMSTLYEMFLKGHSIQEHGRCLGWRSSSQTGFDNWLTYGEVLLVQYACYRHSMCPVPMYETLGHEGLEHICNQTKLELVVCENEDKIQLLLELGDSNKHIKTVIHIAPVSDDIRDKVLARKWKLISFAELEKIGKEKPADPVMCKPDDLCLIIYTSGTTGKPKGAMIAHRGLVSSSLAALAGVEKLYPDFWGKGKEVHLSYLPMAHMYEQLVLAWMLKDGNAIGFYSGDVKELMGDLKALRPTFFGSVPRLLNRLYDRVMASVNQSKIKSYLFNLGMDKKEEYFKRGIITKSTIWDKLLFKKVQDILGGQVKMITTGSAPISAPVIRFYRLVTGALVLEGYGQTESSTVMSLCLPNDSCAGEVGPPITCCMIKLVDVPEMDCYAAKNKGEVCCYGYNVFKGYLYDEEKTKEAIDSEGWLHTGDIGCWTERGTLKIVDRKKNIFKLAQGEYLAPEKIENVYCSSPLVAQCFVHGDSLKSCVVAIVVPDGDVLPNFAKQNFNVEGSLEDLCKHRQVKDALLDSMIQTGKAAGLKGFEQVKDIFLTAEPFSVENGLLTPNL